MHDWAANESYYLPIRRSHVLHVVVLVVHSAESRSTNILLFVREAQTKVGENEEGSKDRRFQQPEGCG